MLETKPLQYTISSLKPNAFFELSQEITNLLENSLHSYSNIVVLCIGTDRSTGDCLGPSGGKTYKILFSSTYKYFRNLR
nr:DUF1256 domain-containing protein [Fervidicella metallireducens]